jgi:hypothetical protein
MSSSEALKKVTFIDVADLKLLEITCPKCKTSVTFDLTNENRNFPDQCLQCHDDWNPIGNSQIQNLFKYFRLFRGMFSGSGSIAAAFRLEEWQPELNNSRFYAWI